MQMNHTLEYNAAAIHKSNKPKPKTLLKRIGSTAYVVSVCFSKTSKETMEDKIFRLIEREVSGRNE
jgi:hypothetical protein